MRGRRRDAETRPRGDATRRDVARYTHAIARAAFSSRRMLRIDHTYPTPAVSMVSHMTICRVTVIKGYGTSGENKYIGS